MRSYALVLLLLVSGLAAAPAAGFFQEATDQKRGMKPDLPGPVHKQLDELAGTWDVATLYTMGDKQHAGKATCEAKWILEGRFLQQDYHTRLQGKPFHVLQLLGYDNPRKRTIEIMIDNLSTGLMHNEGSISDDGKVITNLGEGLDPLTKKPYKLRTVTTIVDHDHFTLDWFRTTEGGNEEKVVSMSHTRKIKN
jgi:Protein of unknown function (DUF1579)